MIGDPIIEELRAHRQAHTARFHYDLAAIVADLIEREKNSSRPVVNRPPRRASERTIGSGAEERTALIV